jgi:predicted metal-dependent phosphotriesterase family hydrolase/predicted ATPase
MVTVPTNAGEVSVEDLGAVLMHEHVFIRTESLQWGWPGFAGWDEESEVAAARERLIRLRRAGVGAIVDLTVPGLGRDPALVARTAEGTGVKVLFATGYFTADRLPLPFQFRGPGRLLDGDDRLLESLFERDLTVGMGATGIRAAVLTVVTDVRGMTEDAERLARAVASVSARTGAVICTQAHAPSQRGLDQQRVFAEHGADLTRVLIGHCSESTDLDYLEELIAAGSYLGWDRCGQSMDVPIEAQLDTLAELCWRGHAGQIMLSHDQASFIDYWPGPEIDQTLPGWPTASIHGGVLPGLRARGVPDAQIEQMLVRNPRDFLARGQSPPAAAGGGARSAAVLVQGGGRTAGSGLSTVGRAGPGRFSGREREIAELRKLARVERMVTLTGPGGTGKTRLLTTLLDTVRDGYPDGAFLVGLADLRQPDLVAARVAAAVGICPENGVPLADTLAEALRGRRLALALDGCEHLASACATLCLQLLASSPGLLILASSRKPLCLAAEVRWPVPPLTLPEDTVPDLTRAARSDAVRLFADRAGAADPGFALDAGNCGAVAAICRAVDGLPLGIELAAARLRRHSVAQVAASLADRLRPPGPGAPASPARQRTTLRSVLGWAEDGLAPDEQVLLRRLSVFEGWTLEMAERICADAVLPAGAIHGLLAGLAEKAMVETAPGLTPAPEVGPGPGPSGPARYRMPAAIRDYAAARLAGAGEGEVLRRRLRDYITSEAEYIASIGTARVPATWTVLTRVFRDYDADVANFREVLGCCLDCGDAEAGLRICAAMRLAWLVRGQHAEGIRWLEAFLAADLSAVPAVVRGPALVAGAQLALANGDYARAESWGQDGLELSRNAADPRFTATALDQMSRAALATGRPKEALRRAIEATDQTGQSHDWFNRGFALGGRSMALSVLGRVAEARDWAEAGLALMLEIDNQWGVALYRLGLGDLARGAGDAAAAREYFLAALPFIREYMLAPDVARCLARIAAASLRLGDIAGCRGYLSESLRLSVAAGNRSGIARGLLAFARLEVRTERPDRAVPLAAAATALCEAAHLPPPPPGRIQRYLDAAAGLGAAETARLWAAGLELTPRAAAELALEPPAMTPAATGLGQNR